MNWHQILMRTGWIFKTESLIMPAVLDMIGGSAFLRSCLPMLNRFGQSVPPLLVAQTIRRSRYKKAGLIAAAMTMGVIFCLLSLLWTFRESLSQTGLIVAILVLYAIFFSSMGIHQLSLSALTGKLIPVTIRGRLMQFSSVLGSTVAVTCAWILLNRWLTPGSANFTAIFLFAGVLFTASASIAFLFREDAGCKIGNGGIVGTAVKGIICRPQTRPKFLVANGNGLFVWNDDDAVSALSIGWQKSIESGL
ncbi:MAG: hypothetical protein R3C03_06180 [Pirellulaceae bacterium]